MGQRRALRVHSRNSGRNKGPLLPPATHIMRSPLSPVARVTLKPAMVRRSNKEVKKKQLGDDTAYEEGRTGSFFDVLRNNARKKNEHARGYHDIII